MRTGSCLHRFGLVVVTVSADGFLRTHLCIVSDSLGNFMTFVSKNAQIGLKQAFFTNEKHCPTQLFVLDHYSEAKSRDFIEIVSILASHSQYAAFHRKDL